MNNIFIIGEYPHSMLKIGPPVETVHSPYKEYDIISFCTMLKNNRIIPVEGQLAELVRLMTENSFPENAIWKTRNINKVLKHPFFMSFDDASDYWLKLSGKMAGIVDDSTFSIDFKVRQRARVRRRNLYRALYAIRKNNPDWISVVDGLDLKSSFRKNAIAIARYQLDQGWSLIPCRVGIYR